MLLADPPSNRVAAKPSALLLTSARLFMRALPAARRSTAGSTSVMSTCTSKCSALACTLPVSAAPAGSGTLTGVSSCKGMHLCSAQLGRQYAHQGAAAADLQHAPASHELCAVS